MSSRALWSKQDEGEMDVVRVFKDAIQLCGFYGFYGTAWLCVDEESGWLLRSRPRKTENDYDWILRLDIEEGGFVRNDKVLLIMKHVTESNNKDKICFNKLTTPDEMEGYASFDITTELLNILLK